jgi:hypothetical protein
VLASEAVSRPSRHGVGPGEEMVGWPSSELGRRVADTPTAGDRQADGG